MARKGYDYDGGGPADQQDAGDILTTVDGRKVDNTKLQGGETFDADTFLKWAPSFSGWQSPDPTKDLEQFLKSQGRSASNINDLKWYQDNYGSMAVKFNSDGTVTYDPASRTNKYSYEGAPGMDFGDLIKYGILAAGGAGIAGLLPGTTSAFSGLGAAAPESFSLSAATPEFVSSAGSVLPEAAAGGFSVAPGATTSALPALGVSTPGMSLAPWASATPGLDMLGPLNAIGSAASVAATNAAFPGTFTPGGAIPSASSLGASAASSGGSALSRLLSGDATTDDLVSLAGTLGATGLGAYASNQQSNALKDIADQARADRAPALNAFNSAIADPNGWYSSAPAMGATESVLRKLSVQSGNPAMNPGALSQAAAYNLGGYNDYLRTTGNLGLSGQDSTIRAQTNAALGDTNLYNSLGAGLQQLTQPRNNLLGSLGQLLLA